MDFYAQYKKYENDLNYNDDGDPENPVRVLTVGLACTMYFRGNASRNC